MFFKNYKIEIEKDIKKLKLEIVDLKTTVETLKKDATAASFLMESTNISPDGFPELDHKELMRNDSTLINSAMDHNTEQQKAWVMKRPSLKIKKIFHGGCLSCTEPVEKGIGYCLGCQYIDADWSKPNLSNGK